MDRLIRFLLLLAIFTTAFLVAVALEQLMCSNPEPNWSLVLNANLDEEINLGKAAELLGIHELELRERFIELGMPL